MRWSWLVLIAACVPGAIPPAARYPAGTRFTTRSVLVLGTRIRLIDAGTGTPVVFVHGIGESMYAWRKNLEPVVDAGYRVVAFDLPGFGFSEKPDSGYSNEAYRRFVLGVMDALGLPDAVLVGHSMGGEIAADVARSSPGRVRGLVLIDAAGMGIRVPLLLRFASWVPIERVALALTPRWAVALALRSTYADPALIEPGDIDQYYAPVLEPGFGHAVSQVLEHFRFDALRGQLAGVQTSTLVVWGGRDRWIPPAFGARLASELPRCAFVVIPTAGHAAQEEAWGRVNDLLLSFLKQGVPEAPADVALAGLAQSR
ncbi:MAG TPA: alpha/beta fold hydrolase [Gemmatimonadales bacterium]|nr:alpha/beta fold hydrolase [Gemmatimonadales bacterium]